MDLDVIENNEHQTSVEHIKSIEFDNVIEGVSTKVGNKYIIATVTNDCIRYDVLHNNNVIPIHDPTNLENAVKLYNSIVLGKIKTFEYMIEGKLINLELLPDLKMFGQFYNEIKNFPTQYDYLGETFILVHQDKIIKIIRVVK